MLLRASYAALLMGLLAFPAVAQPNGQQAAAGQILDGKDIVLQPFAPGSPSEAFYPPQAQRLGIQGRAILLCDIGSDLGLSCVAESESPPDMGFGAAAVRLFDEMHVKPQTKYGEPVSGRRVRFTFNFRLH